jgi:Abortive infection C-terminus
MFHQTLLDKVMELQDGLVAEATRSEFSGSETSAGQFVDGKTRYASLRSELLLAPETSERLPNFVRKCFSLFDFRKFISGELDDYSARRRFLWDSFQPLISALKGDPIAPAGATITSRLESLRAATVEATWSKALARREDDPEGAITVAVTLLESVCKHLIEARGLTRDEKAKLDKATLRQLFTQCTKSLRLAPGQNMQKSVKIVLGNCQSVVEQLARLRNTIGDAHGRGHLHTKPAPRHAELAVNLAGSLAAFLAATWVEKNNEDFPF